MNDQATMTAPRAAHAVRTSPATRGIHHLVLTTEDMKMTIDFYTEVMGMPLVHALKTPPGIGTGKGNRGNPPFEEIRHYFFDMGNDSLLAFFEMPKGAKTASDRDAIGGMQHVSFMILPREFKELQARLAARSIPVIGPSKMASNPGHSLYFNDPNGVRMEVSCDTTKDVPSAVLDATQTQEVCREELKSLCDDEAWLEKVTAHLPK